MKEAHWRIGEILHANLDHGKHFEEFLSAASIVLEQADIGLCKNMRTLYQRLHIRGKIKVGSYKRLYDIIVASKLMYLEPFVNKEKEFINSLQTNRKHNATDLEIPSSVSPSLSLRVAQESSPPDPEISSSVSPSLCPLIVQESLPPDTVPSVSTTGEPFLSTSEALLRNTAGVSDSTETVSLNEEMYSDLSSSRPTQVTRETGGRPFVNQQSTLPDQPKKYNQHVENDQVSQPSSCSEPPNPKTLSPLSGFHGMFE